MEGVVSMVVPLNDTSLGVEPGDRYITSAPCGPHCVRRTGRRTAEQEKHPQGLGSACYVGVAPYSYTFRAPVKGRWLDMPLLSVFVKEFAHVGAPPAVAPSTTATGSSSERSQLDRRLNVLAYVEELCSGRLWLHGREAECRLAGKSYRDALVQYVATHDASFTALPLEDRSDPADAIRWAAVGRWFSEHESPANVNRILHETLPQLLILRQRDTVYHQVCREEGRLFADQPLHIVRCDLPTSSPGASVAESRSLVVLSKPPGLPVHPSGSYRKNSVTAILEDIFGGNDRHRYCVEEHFEPPVEKGAAACLSYASICHRELHFELIRVWIRSPKGTTRPLGIHGGAGASHVGGVRLEQWEQLKQLLSQPAVGNEAGAGTKRDRSGAWTRRSQNEALHPYVVHRLDAATSGVLLFGLNSEAARTAATLISNKDAPDDPQETGPSCMKQYLALVHGCVRPADLAAGQHHCRLVPLKVPDETTQSAEVLRVDRPVGCLSFHKSLYWSPSAARTDYFEAERRRSSADQPSLPGDRSFSPAAAKRNGVDGLEAKHEHMRQLSRGGRRGNTDLASAVVRAGDRLDAFERSLRHASTLVEVIGYDPVAQTTLLECSLLTGRTHQLRVHLASIGHPIVHDNKYVDLLAALQRERTQHDSQSTDETADDVSLYFRMMESEERAPSRRACDDEVDDRGSVSQGTDGSMAGHDDGDAHDSCLCPRRICLHAWRYSLRYSASEEPEVFEVPPPGWASGFEKSTSHVGGHVSLRQAPLGELLWESE